MRIVHYPHPSLKHPGKPVGLIDRQLRLWVGEMFELMYDAKGLGLAAPQVALPFQLLVMNVEGKTGDGDIVLHEHQRRAPLRKRAPGRNGVAVDRGDGIERRRPVDQTFECRLVDDGSYPSAMVTDLLSV